MKYNLLTFLGAGIMVIMMVSILFGAMTVYEKNQFKQTWSVYPTVIEKELKPLYSESFDADSDEY